MVPFQEFDKIIKNIFSQACDFLYLSNFLLHSDMDITISLNLHECNHLNTFILPSNLLSDYLQECWITPGVSVLIKILFFFLRWEADEFPYIAQRMKIITMGKLQGLSSSKSFFLTVIYHYSESPLIFINPIPTCSV